MANLGHMAGEDRGVGWEGGRPEAPGSLHDRPAMPGPEQTSLLYITLHELSLIGTLRFVVIPQVLIAHECSHHLYPE